MEETRKKGDGCHTYSVYANSYGEVIMERYKVFCTLEATFLDTGEVHRQVFWPSQYPKDTDHAKDAIDEVKQEQYDYYVSINKKVDMDDDELRVDFGDLKYRFYDYDVQAIPDAPFLRKYREKNKEAMELIRELRKKSK